MKERVPWWGKILAKLVMTRLPTRYAAWRRLNLFRHGHMDRAGYALDTFKTHVARAGLAGRLEGKTVLELGPGDSVASALIAHAYGARAVLVDAGLFATDDLTVYRKTATLLESERLASIDLAGLDSLTGVLNACDARYLGNGLDSLREIPDGTVDFIFSQAVLEHVRKAEFLDTMRECARVLRPDGVCSHRVDLKDHLGGGLNNLRFSDRVWESDFFTRSGFYTNRIPYGTMLGDFERAGFDVEVTDIRCWETLPIGRQGLASEFRDVPDETLRVSGFDVVLRPGGSR